MCSSILKTGKMFIAIIVIIHVHMVTANLLRGSFVAEGCGFGILCAGIYGSVQMRQAFVTRTLRP